MRHAALEPMTAADDEPNQELAAMTRRFCGAAPTAPLVLLAMADMLPGKPLERSTSPTPACCNALATPLSSGAVGRYSHAVGSIVNRGLNMFTLIAIGVGVAYLYSLAALLALACFRLHFKWKAESPPISKRRR